VDAGRRKIEIDKFQENEDHRIFILSLKAGGVGINLTSADYVILFDPWWNPAVENQAIDRLYRIGQSRKVIAYKMVVKNTVEEKMLELQERKKKLVGQLITTESSFFKSLEKEDIARLFEAV
jgi:SNF2 family DNA or RNA helicase